MNINLNHYLLRRINFFYKQFFRLISIRISHKAFGSSAFRKLIDSVYIINLDRQPERWSRILAELQREKAIGRSTLVDYSHRIRAIDNKIIDIDCVSPKEIDKVFNLRDQYTVDPDPRLLDIIREKEIFVTMTIEEIAVCLSHISCWKRIIDENHPYTLILEDDIFFEGFFSKKLNAIWDELPVDQSGAPDFDLLYLSYREVDRGAQKTRYSRHLNKPTNGLWWLSGYVLSNKGAKKLIHSLPVRGPVDLWINLQFSKMDVYTSIPSLIFQRNDLASGNNYSIMPVLSQIGIQSDSTHLELQQKKGRNPVFVFAENESQMDAIDSALAILGYRCYCSGLQEAGQLDQMIERNEPLLYDAYLGTDIAKHTQKLALMYPLGVFIWVSKYKAGFKQDIKKAISDVLGEPILDLDMKRHLCINSDCLTWKNICRFLSCKEPPISFPIEKMSSNLIFESHETINPIERELVYLEHDVTPWILPIHRMDDFGLSHIRNYFKLSGKFEPILNEGFNTFDKVKWKLLEDSFPSNLAAFIPENFQILSNGGIELTLKKEEAGSRSYSSASVKTHNEYLYGRFSVIMKPVKMDGVVTAFFLHRNDPWQELDIEFLGKDTTRILLNVFYNPGGNGSGWNYGVRGTPVWIDLGFDAADAFHLYSIEWDPDSIKWFVDGNLLHIRKIWQPSLIPNQPMSVFVNFWASASEELAGEFLGQNLPVSALFKNISIYSWQPKLLTDING